MRQRSFTPAANTFVGIFGLLMSLDASAFLTDTSNQRVVMIGKGGAENMQRVQVQDIRSNIASTPAVQSQTTITAQPANTVQYQQKAQYQQPQYEQPQYQPQYQQSYSTQYNNQYNSQYNSTYSQNTAYTQNFNQLFVNTNAVAATVYDLQTGQPLYQKNADATRSIASITKMMTAMVVLDSGQDMRDELVISSSDLVGAKQASSRLKAGDRLTRSEFMLMMLMKSENPAAKALASNYFGGYDAFISAMNQKAQSLGMYSTRFSDASGLDPRNISSANDLVKMMREVATNPRYQTIRNFSTAKSYDFYITNYNSGNRTYSAANTNRLVRDGGYPIGASKTGFIRESKRSVVMETHVNGKPAIIVLLGADSTQDRDRDAENILSQLAYR